MVNPDGVYLGNHRTGAVGMDMNRCFQGSNYDPEVFPEIAMIVSEVARIKKAKNLRFLIDLHGHSAKRNIFEALQVTTNPTTGEIALSPALKGMRMNVTSKANTLTKSQHKHKQTNKKVCNTCTS